MKVYFETEMPEDCSKCIFFSRSVECFPLRKNITYEELLKGKPDWCPLKQFPQKKDIDKTLEFGGYENIIQESLARGYNACLEEIQNDN